MGTTIMRVARAYRILLAGFLFLTSAAGQKPSSEPKGSAPSPAPAPAPEDPLGRTTPYGTVVWFMRAFETRDAVQAIQYLDERRSIAEKEKIAEQLGRVLNRAMKLEIGSLSKEPSGDLNDKLRKNRELVGVAAAGTDKLEIYLDRVERGNQPPIWLFSSETLAAIPDFEAKVEGPWQEKYLPKALLDNKVLSLELYRWLAIPLFVGLIYAGTGLLTWLLTHLLRPVVDFLSGQRGGPEIRVGSTGPIRMMLFAVALWFLRDLPVTALARHFWELTTAILFVASIAWILVRAIKIVVGATAARMRHRHTPEKIALANLAGRLTQILVGLSAMLLILHIVGVELTGVFAGLGLGGVALALGAQKTLENFLGGVMVIGDAPVRVGDTCKVGEYVGTIEDIGLRSTRIRTADRTLVHIPNAHLSAVSLENFAERDKTLFRHILGLQRETTTEQLRCIVDQSEKTLSAHGSVEPGSARMRFTKVGESSLDFEVRAYVLKTDPAAFLQIQQDLLFGIMEIIESCGARLAVPTQMHLSSANAVPGQSEPR